MPIKVAQSKDPGGVNVPTMDEFNALMKRVADLETKAIMSGASVSLSSTTRHEFITWMDVGQAVQSRGTPYTPDLQSWTIDRH